MILVLANLHQGIAGVIKSLINATVVVYFIPFLYMFAAVVRLAYKKDREHDTEAALIPGGKAGVWIAAALGFVVTFVSIVLAFIPSKDVTNKTAYEIGLIVGIHGCSL